MSTVAPAALNPDLGAIDPSVLEPASSAVVAVSSNQLADEHQGAASDDDFPIAIVVVVLVLIVAGVTAGVLGFRSTRRKRDDIQAHGRQEPDPR